MRRIFGAISKLTLALDEMRDGAYSVTWFDPATSTWLPSATLSTRDGRHSAPIPPFATDIAASIARSGD